MTIATTVQRVDALGNGVGTVFSFAPMAIFTPNDLLVIIRDSAGNETVVAQGSGANQYSLAVNVYPGTGTVTYPALVSATPLPAGSTISIRRVVALLQSVALQNQSAYFASVQEGEFDYLTAIDQQQQEQISRALVVSQTDTPVGPLPSSVARANQLLGFDSAGRAIAAQPSSALVSSVMQPVVNAASTKLALAALGTGPVVTPAQFGAVGNNVADDTAAVQAAMNAASATNSLLMLIGSTSTNFKITAPLIVPSNLRVSAPGLGNTALIASGNFGAVLSFGTTAAQIWLEHFQIITTGTTTRCVTLAQGAQGVKFFEVGFTGSLNGILIYSQAAGFLEFEACVWGCAGASTVGLVLDGYNQNTSIIGGHAGGIGEFLVIENTGGNSIFNVQGLRVTGFCSICTGLTAITVGGGSFGIFFSDCVIDQAGTACILIEAGASLTQISGGYFGVTNNTLGICIQLAPTCGVGTTIDGVQTFGGAQSIAVQASASSRVGGVAIQNCLFNAGVSGTLVLDSVNGCLVQDNFDLSNPTNGSWSTLATFGPGNYTFGGNSWSTRALAVVHTTSSYHAIADRGVTLANKGAAISGAGATTLVINHGLSITPNNIQVTPNGATGAYNLLNVTGASFQIAWANAGVFTWYWTAEVFN